MKSIWIECKKISLVIVVLTTVFTGAYWLLEVDDSKAKYNTPSFEIFARR